MDIQTKEATSTIIHNFRVRIRKPKYNIARVFIFDFNAVLLSWPETNNTNVVLTSYMGIFLKLI